MKTAKQSRITGGKRGFMAAVDDAFYGEGRRKYNPGVRYSHARGFHCESMLVPADPDVLWSAQVSFDGEGNRSLNSSSYAQVRDSILNPLF